MNRRNNIWRNLDWLTAGLFIILVSLGWINIYSAEYNDQNPGILNLSERYGKQLLWIGAAIIVVIFLIIIDARFYMFFSYYLYAAVILSLVAVIFFGKEIHGSRSWFVFGDFRLQPSEFAKFATSLALARFLSSPNIRLGNFMHVVRTALIICFPAFLILLQPDTGSTLVYAALLIVLYREGLPAVYLIIGFLAPVLFILTLILNPFMTITGMVIIAFAYYFIISYHKNRAIAGAVIFIGLGTLLTLANLFFHLNISNYFLVAGTLGISGIIYAFLAYKYKLRNAVLVFLFLAGSIAYTFSVNYVFNNVLEDHQQKRINVVLGIENDPLGSGYNVNQSKIAIGSGGFSGKGFLRGTQTKFNFVPEQSTDFIFCTIGEEWGFLGTSFIVMLFAFLLIRLLFLSERQKSRFSRIYGYSVLSILAFHFIINIGMTIGLVPVIGIPLPFVSYGGSSLWGFTILLFIFLRLDAARSEFL